MDKLKEVIKEYGCWSELSIYVERIESHVEIDFSHSLENAKALLETIGKEICKQNEVDLSDDSSVNGVMKQAFMSMGFSNANMVLQISRSLANIGQNIGNIRNEIGISSHGKTIDEIRERNCKIDLMTRDFILETIESISVFLIRNFESNKNLGVSEPLKDVPDYNKAEDFNESWDETFGEFSMGDYSYTASEILFNVDKQVYVNEYRAYVELEEE